MAALWILSCLGVLSLHAGLFESLENKTVANAAECARLSDEQCPLVSACILSGATCAADPCYGGIVAAGTACSGGASCDKYNADAYSFCVTSSRKSSIDNICSLEFGENKVTEEIACYSLQGCEGVTPLTIDVSTEYYLCNKAPPASDPCSSITEEICPYIGKCMWEGGACKADGCWEKTYSSADGCDTGCTKKVITGSGATELGYCKNGTHDLHSKCNAGTGTNAVTKKIVCTGYGSPCDNSKIVTIKNYEGGTLYVCNDEEKNFTLPSTDPCSTLSEEICPYIGKCMWEGGVCIADGCWEKTYSSQDDCKAGCTKKVITGSGFNELGYCKNGTHDLKSKCNAGTGTNFVTKSLACTGYPSECEKIVTINNYEGGTLYVCNDEEKELTVPSPEGEGAALPLRISTLALFAVLMLLALSL